MRFIGCKRQLLDNIKDTVDRHVQGARTFCDIFSGTASVAKYFKQWYEVYSNDLLYFSYCIQKATVENQKIPEFCNLINKIKIDSPIGFLNNIEIDEMETLSKENRFFQNNYSPTGGRMYLTDINALRIDFARNKINQWKAEKLISDIEYFYLVACVVEGIPYVSNISGTYGAYNKTWDVRSNKKFELKPLSVISNEKNNCAYNENGIDLLKHISGDILYIDPPYNERQYLPNYHVLETAAKYDFPVLKGVTGQRPYEGQKSEFCSKKTAIQSFEKLIKNAQFKHIIMSYNTDGIMPVKDIFDIMKTYGKADTFEITSIPYRRFKSKNSTERKDELKELIIYISKEV